MRRWSTISYSQRRGRTGWRLIAAAMVVVTMLLVPMATAAGTPAPGGVRSVDGARGSKDARPGELLVRFHASATTEQRDAALKAVNATLTKQFAALDAGVVKFDPEASEAVQKELEAHPAIAYVEPNYLVHALDTGVMPDDPSFTSQWGLHNTGQLAGEINGMPDADIDAPEAWQVTTGSSDIVVGVIDTGVDFANPDLGGNNKSNPRMWTNPGEMCNGCAGDGFDNDGNGYIDDWRGWDFVAEDNNPFDDNGHGTHVAGILGASGNNGSGTAGVSWNVKIAGLKFLNNAGGGSLADGVEAILYASRMGIPITNNSWGSAEFSQLLYDAMAEAGRNGMLMVVAAGNDGFNADGGGAYPAAFDLPNILSVAATNNLDQLAWFSNFGKNSIDIGAPGEHILSTYRNSETPPGGYPYAYLNGTSMATPYVSGAAALVMSRYPDADALALKALLLSTGDPVAGLAAVTRSGARLNVNRAVRCADEPMVWIESPGSDVAVETGAEVTFSAIVSNCASAENVTVSAMAGSQTVELTAQGGGLYTGVITLEQPGTVTLRVTAGAAGRSDSESIDLAAVNNYRVSNVAYDWVEIGATATRTLINTDDGTEVAPMPFSFKLYDREFSQVTISANGYLVFGDGRATSFINRGFPWPGQPNGVVAPFWDDLNPAVAGAIWYDTIGQAPNRTFVVSWLDLPHYNDIGAVSFQALLHEGSNEITFQYSDVEFANASFDYGRSATVGVEHPLGTVGRTFLNGTNGLRAYEGRLGVRFDEQLPGEPAISTYFLDQATVSQPYSDTLEATGGTPPFSWSIVGGTLPPGLSLDSATGEISGTPPESGSWEFTVRLTDAAGNSVDQLLSIDVVIGYAYEEIPFDWIEAREGGTNLGFTTDDSSVDVTLPFNFTYYDGEFSSVRVSSNGYLVFGNSAATRFSNTALPNVAEPNGVVAAFWDDLSPQDGGNVWMRTAGEAPNRTVVIQWTETPRYKMNGAATFQIQLEEGSNAIEMHWLDTNFDFSVWNFASAATIGLENLTGTAGTQFSYDEPVLEPYDGVTGLRFTQIVSGAPGPSITSVPPDDATVGEPYAYQPTASGTGELTWSLVSGPDGMSVDPASGLVSWTPAAAGVYAVALQVSDDNGSDTQEWEIIAQITGLEEMTLNVTEGYDAGAAELLSVLGTLTSVQASDDNRLEIAAGNSVSLEFDATVPAGTTIQSVTLVIEHYEEAGLTPISIEWRAGVGQLADPTTLLTMTPDPVPGEAAEKADQWVVTTTFPDASVVNDLKFTVVNAGTDGIVWLDHVQVLVTFAPAAT